MFMVALPAVPVPAEEVADTQEAAGAGALRESGVKADSNIDFTDS
jgi:hypothetical protein